VGYPLDETFAASIPAGFASASGAGGVTPTYNSGQQAADLVFTQAQNHWRMLTVPASKDFWFEMDVEVVTLVYTPAHFGVWLADGTGVYQGILPSLVSSLSGCSAWNNTGIEAYYSTNYSDNAWAVATGRKRYRVDVKVHATLPYARATIKIDDVVIANFVQRMYANGSLIPGVFGYGCTLRIHQVKGDEPSDLGALQEIGVNPTLAPIGRRMMRSEVPPLTQVKLMPIIHSRNNLAPWGKYKIAGLVQIKGTPNYPVSRKVVLYDEQQGIPVAEQWSDAATGAYLFEQVREDRRYTVFTYDHEHNFRAVIADNIAPELKT